MKLAISSSGVGTTDMHTHGGGWLVKVRNPVPEGAITVDAAISP